MKTKSLCGAYARSTGQNQPHVPLMIPDINTDIDILFVGMNPSHRVAWIERQLQANAERFKREVKVGSRGYV